MRCFSAHSMVPYINLRIWETLEVHMVMHCYIYVTNAFSWVRQPDMQLTIKIMNTFYWYDMNLLLIWLRFRGSESIDGLDFNAMLFNGKNSGL